MGQVPHHLSTQLGRQAGWRGVPPSVRFAMPYIRQVEVAQASGLLKKIFDHSLERAGRIWKIIHVMSVNPRAMDGSLEFYRALMFGRSPLSRVQREMLAVVTSKANECFY